jgi:hypothetical protein
MGWLRSNYRVLHICTRGLHVGRCPPQPLSVLGPAPTLSPSFLLARAIFEPNIFPYKYPTFSKLVILCTYPPMKMEQTQCSETSAYKIQTPGNYPEESIQHSEHGESLKSRKQTNILIKKSICTYRCIMVVQKAACCRLHKTTISRLHIPEIQRD